jgi:hypothetical protein
VFFQTFGKNMKNAGGVDNHHLANLKKTNSVIQNFNQAKQCKMRFFRRVTLLESVTLIVGVTFIFVVDLGDAFGVTPKKQWRDAHGQRHSLDDFQHRKVWRRTH